MKNFFNLLVFLMVLSVSAQTNFDTSSFNVSKVDLITNNYIADSTANSLVIYEEGNSFFHRKKFKLITEVKKKIKIFNKDGAEKSIIEIHLYNNDSKRKIEKISAIKAATYNLKNDKIIFTTLKKSDIYKEVYDQNYTIVKFTLPNIQEGSVITYSYTLESPFMYKYKGWEFQDDIPKLYSEYRTSIPGNYDYNIKLVGKSRLAVNTSKLVKNCLTVFNGGTADCSDSRYVMTNIPAFIEEDYMTTKDNYLSRIEYELKVFYGFDGRVDKITKTWKDVDKELKTDPNIGKQLSKTGLVKNLLHSSNLDNKTTLEKAITIYNYVQKNYVWDGKHKIFKNVSVKDLIKNKSGNVSEINILLHNLLNLHGISSRPILLSTRNNGLATKIYPVLSDFNYLIVQATVEGKTYLLDATSNYLSFGDIPFKCLNNKGRLLDFKNGSKWVDIKPQSISSTQHKIDLSINTGEASLTGTVNSRYSGYHSLTKKRNYFSNESKYKEEFENKFQELEISELNIDCKTRAEEKFNESFNVEYHDLNIAGDKIYLNPFLIKFFTKNPFQLQERTYPVDFGYKDSYLYSFQIDLGEDYVVEELPKNISMKLPENGGDLIFNTKILNNKVIVFFTLRFKKEIYYSNAYATLKHFMSKVVDVQSKTIIVLKKK